jgi:hypothetical protein
MSDPISIAIADGMADVLLMRLDRMKCARSRNVRSLAETCDRLCEKRGRGPSLCRRDQCLSVKFREGHKVRGRPLSRRG